MAVLIIVTFAYLVFVWAVFFEFKWLKFNPGWAIVSVLILLHIFLGFIIGLRFVTPYSTNAKMVQYTVQLIPRLPEPTLVTAVLVGQNVHVRKGQPLFLFDRRPYEYQVRQHEGLLNSDLAKVASTRYRVEQLKVQVTDAVRDVGVYKADLGAAKQRVLKGRSDLKYAKFQEVHFHRLIQKGAAPVESYQKWAADVHALEAQVEEAQADVERARLKYVTQSGGVNTTVALAQAQLKQGEADYADANAAVKSEEAQLDLARYYLNNTTMVAPADGYIVNLQVRPGMVSGILRVGGIASFIEDSNRYVLATFDQPVLKWVRPGQPVEVAFDLYPGQIFKARVNSIWWASGEGQYLPSDVLPTFAVEPPNSKVQTRFAVKIDIDESEMDGPLDRFPIGAQGVAAIYTSQGPWAALRRIAIRTDSWFNWLYPLPF